MPIKDKSRYPQNWKAIRAAILSRASHHCEGCGVANHAWIRRAVQNGAVFRYWSKALSEFMMADCAVFHGLTWKNPVRVVLTIAHLDHIPEHCDGMEAGGEVKPVSKSNLRAWCQRCHNTYDAPFRAMNRRKKGKI